MMSPARMPAAVPVRKETANFVNPKVFLLLNISGLHRMFNAIPAPGRCRRSRLRVTRTCDERECGTVANVRRRRRDSLHDLRLGDSHAPRVFFERSWKRAFPTRSSRSRHAAHVPGTRAHVPDTQRAFPTRQRTFPTRSAHSRNAVHAPDTQRTFPERVLRSRASVRATFPRVGFAFR